jgi:SAM-dependent methyltransferase
MEFHSLYGLNAPGFGWTPAPRYLLRRNRVLKLLSGLTPGRLLEVGCGAGALLRDLDHAGFLCSALETSPAALDLARTINRDLPRTSLFSEPRHSWSGSFEVLLALEVLEHIEDDRQVLALWRSWLGPRGMLLISVPAHPQRWNATDDWAGHVRRYRRQGLQDLLEASGFSIIHLECYGFPLANVLEPIRARHHARLLREQRKPPEQTPIPEISGDRSGIERSMEVRLSPLLFSKAGVGIMRLAFFIQGLFSRTDWGNGYLVLAQRQP